MKGRYEIIIQNSYAQFKIAVSRNITILRGESATGKTTLIDLVRQYSLNGVASGVNLSCKKMCTTLSGIRWQSEISQISDSIVFLDEGFDFVSSPEFASAIKESDNYYVIATREALFNLPYSVREIYGLRNVTRRSKYQVYDRIYSEYYPIYNDEMLVGKPDAVIVEDTNAGYEFFKAICNRENMRCISAKGKSSIYNVVKNCDADVALVVADGAAFGPELERALALRKAKNVLYFLPESFEWLILKSGLIDGREVADVLSHPYDFIDSEQYFSWERFFTALLTDNTKGTYLSYSKKKLNPNFLNKKEMSAIEDVMHEMMG